jgi:hypothetical protein
MMEDGMTKTTSAHTTAADTTAAVDAFMATLAHPHKDAIERLRRCMLAVDPAVREGVKWNAPSFRTIDYFATTNLRARSGIGVILHFGAKARALPAGGIAIDDPDGLLKWLGKDRAMVEFADEHALAGATAAFQAVLRQWLTYL